MMKFRSRNLYLLVATDVVASGLDLNDLTHVINFSPIDDSEIYAHRCGRTGRAWEKGISLSLVHLKEKNNLHMIEKLLVKSFKAIPIPKGRDICKKHLMNWISNLEIVSTDHQEIEKLLPEIRLKLADIGRDELINRVIPHEFAKFLDDCSHDEDIIGPVTERKNNSLKPGKRELSRQTYRN